MKLARVTPDLFKKDQSQSPAPSQSLIVENGNLIIKPRQDPPARTEYLFFTMPPKVGIQTHFPEKHQKLGLIFCLNGEEFKTSAVPVLSLEKMFSKGDECPFVLGQAPGIILSGHIYLIDWEKESPKGQGTKKTEPSSVLPAPVSPSRLGLKAISLSEKTTFPAAEILNALKALSPELMTWFEVQRIKKHSIRTSAEFLAIIKQYGGQGTSPLPELKDYFVMILDDFKRSLEKETRPLEKWEKDVLLLLNDESITKQTVDLLTVIAERPKTNDPASQSAVDVRQSNDSASQAAADARQKIQKMTENMTELRQKKMDEARQAPLKVKELKSLVVTYVEGFDPEWFSILNRETMPINKILPLLGVTSKDINPLFEGVSQPSPFELMVKIVEGLAQKKNIKVTIKEREKFKREFNRRVVT